MCQGGTDAAKPPARSKIVRRKRSEDRERSKHGGKSPRHLLESSTSRTAEQLPRRRVAAVARAVHQRPQSSGRLRLLAWATEKASADAEQESAAKTECLRRRFAPRERIQHWNPRIFEPRQLRPAHAFRDQVCANLLKPWFRGRLAPVIEFLQAFAPPGHADGAERRLRGRRDDVGKREVEVPECF
jgi:hypothetical protein